MVAENFRLDRYKHSAPVALLSVLLNGACCPTMFHASLSCSKPFIFPCRTHGAENNVDYLQM